MPRHARTGPRMTKQRRRRIKEVYPRACEGDLKAIADLSRLMRGPGGFGACEVCGKMAQGERCSMHRRNLNSVPKGLLHE